jgi:hypothetical protein
MHTKDARHLAAELRGCVEFEMDEQERLENYYQKTTISGGKRYAALAQLAKLLRWYTDELPLDMLAAEKRNDAA